jgi:very-short-patch-repair endonuclease
VLRALVEELVGGAAPTESELESRVLDLLEAEGLPRPDTQPRTRAGGGRWRLDFLYRRERVVIEADGYASHSTAEMFERDRARNNALAASGYVVLHWTWAALCDRPEALVHQLRCLLAARGASFPLR